MFKISFSVSAGNILSMNNVEKHSPAVYMVFGDVGLFRHENRFLEFINMVLEGHRVEPYNGEVCTAEVVQKDGRKLIRVYDRFLMHDLAQGRIHCSKDELETIIKPEELRDLLKLWISEREKFNQDPQAYKKELEKAGGAKIIELDATGHQRL